jgi:hypothetical protein
MPAGLPGAGRPAQLDGYPAGVISSYRKGQVSTTVRLTLLSVAAGTDCNCENRNSPFPHFQMPTFPRLKHLLNVPSQALGFPPSRNVIRQFGALIVAIGTATGDVEMVFRHGVETIPRRRPFLAPLCPFQVGPFLPFSSASFPQRNLRTLSRVIAKGRQQYCPATANCALKGLKGVEACDATPATFQTRLAT